MTKKRAVEIKPGVDHSTVAAVHVAPIIEMDARDDAHLIAMCVARRADVGYKRGHMQPKG
jgi:hypothetical protein